MPVQSGPPSGAGAVLPQRRPLPPTPQEGPLVSGSATATGLSHAMSVRRKPVASITETENTLPALALTRSMYSPPPGEVPPPLPDRPCIVSRRDTPASRSQTAPTATLIRRDLSAGTQSNVGRIVDPPTGGVSSDVSINSKSLLSAGSPLYLEIYGPGYRKLETGTAVHGSDSSIGTTPSLASSLSTDDSSPRQAMEGIFKRRMWMEGSHFSSGSHWRRSLMDRGSSGGFSDRPFSLPVPNEGRLQASGPKRSSNRNYTFLSPWQGRCEFTTATMGTSLKVSDNGFKGGVSD